MNFYVADHSEGLKKNLESILGVRGIDTFDSDDKRSNFGFVKAVITDPYCFFIDEDSNDSSRNFSLEYKGVLNCFLRMGIPVVVYSVSPESKINSFGFSAGVHYSRYFSKENDSLNDVADFVRPYVLASFNEREN
jgi:hypothetical protein